MEGNRRRKGSPRTTCRWSLKKELVGESGRDKQERAKKMAQKMVPHRNRWRVFEKAVYSLGKENV